MLILIHGIFAVILCYKIEIEEKSTKVEGYTEEQFFEDLVISNNAGILQKIKLFNNGNGYTVFLPAEMENDARLYFNACKSIVIEGNGKYKNGDSIRNIFDGIVYKTQFIGWDNDVKAETKLAFYHATGIPTVYIATDVGTTASIDRDQDIKIDAHFMMIDVEGNRDSEGECTIKTRGMSSSGAAQKSYNIKTESYISPFGMDSATEWAFLANYGGSTQQLQNKLTFDLAKRIGLEYTPDSDFCNVYIDGVYRGLYLLTERATIDGGSVKLDDMTLEHRKNGDEGEEKEPVIIEVDDEKLNRYKVSTVSANDITGGYLLEKNSRYSFDDNYFWTCISPAFVVKNPSSLSDEEFVYISSYVCAAMDTLYNSDSTTEELQKYFDFDSWLKVYLMEDFACEWDVEYDSFKFYKKRGEEKLFAGPLWDFDLAYGSWAFGSFSGLSKQTRWIEDDRKGTILYKLSCNELFNSRLKEMYNKLLSPEVYDYMNTEFLEIAESNETSFIMSKIRWEEETHDYRNDVNNLYNWIMERRSFLDDYINNPETFHKVKFEFQWGNYTYYVKDGEPLNYLPTAAYGENDYGQFGIVANWVNSDGLQIDVTQPVMEDMTVYPVMVDSNQTVFSSAFMWLIQNKISISNENKVSLDLSGVSIPFTVSKIYAAYKQDGNTITTMTQMKSEDKNDTAVYSCQLDLSDWDAEESKIYISFVDSSDMVYSDVAMISGDLDLKQNHTDISTYLETLQNCPDSYAIIIAAYDEASSGITTEIAEELSGLGLKKELVGKYRYGYIAVIENGKIKEKLGHARQSMKTVLQDSAPVYVVSAGLDAGAEVSVLIDGIEYAVAARGLNFIVYDNNQHRVIDATVFDTGP